MPVTATGMLSDDRAVLTSFSGSEVIQPRRPPDPHEAQFRTTLDVRLLACA